MSETEGHAAAQILRARGVEGRTEIAIVLGTGLGTIADGLSDPIEIAYADLPGFPPAGVSGHAGRLVVGTWEGVRLAVMQGRAHFYETGDAGAMREPLAVLHAIGVNTLILTNSAGSLHADWYPGSMVLISDHINLSGTNPLIGAGGDDRFVSLADAYDRYLRTRLRAAAVQAGVTTVREGVYMWFAGPSFETPAEVKMAKTLGADLVGMSTVPEVILARRLGIKVAAISMITNFATGIGGGKPSHTETKDVALSGSIGLKRLLRAYLRALRDDA